MNPDTKSLKRRYRKNRVFRAYPFKTFIEMLTDGSDIQMSEMARGWLQRKAAGQ